MIVRHDALARIRGNDDGPEPLGEPGHIRPRRTTAGHDDRALGTCEQVSGPGHRRRVRSGASGQCNRLPIALYMGLQHVDRHRDVDRTRALGRKNREGLGQKLRHVLGSPCAAAEGGQRPRHRVQVRHLVQHPPALAQRVALRVRREKQHRHRVAVSLAERRRGVRHARSRDGQCHARPPAGPGITVRHKARAHLVARLDMGNRSALAPGFSQPPAKVERVNAGDAEDRVDPVAREKAHRRLAGGNGHPLPPKPRPAATGRGPGSCRPPSRRS